MTPRERRDLPYLIAAAMAALALAIGGAWWRGWL